MIHESDASRSVRQFMTAFGQPVRMKPTHIITDQERLLRARLVLEEAIEFVESMGCIVAYKPNNDEPDMIGVVGDAITALPLPGVSIDVEKAADALADSLVVVYGSAHTLGIPLDSVFSEVHRSNMSKLGHDGKPLLREDDGKVLKGPQYTPPNVAGVLARYQ